MTTTLKMDREVVVAIWFKLPTDPRWRCLGAVGAIRVAEDIVLGLENTRAEFQILRAGEHPDSAPTRAST